MAAKDSRGQVAAIFERWVEACLVLGDEVEAAEICGDRQDLLPQVKALIAEFEQVNSALPSTLTGRRLGPYRFGEILGRGGMGVVYEATDVALGRPTAIKVLRQGFSEPLRRRLLREARMTARLQHPNIATFYDAGRLDDIDYVALELVKGETLRSEIEKGPLDLDRALALMAQILQALSHAHGWGVVHRDIKPENVVVGDRGAVKVLDFGLAGPLQPEVEGARDETDADESGAGDWHSKQVDPQRLSQSLLSLTRSGVLMGTPAYMAPEQVVGLPVDLRADLFAAGALLFEMVAGHRAFAGDSLAEICASVVAGPPTERLEEIEPRRLREVLTRCLQPSPGQRFASASDLLEAVRDLAGTSAMALGPVVLAILDIGASAAKDRTAAATLNEAFYQGFAVIDGLRLVARERLRAMADRGTQRREARGRGKENETQGAVPTLDSQARHLGATAVLSGSLESARSTRVLTIRLWRGSFVHEQQLRGNLQELVDGVPAAVAELSTALGLKPTSRQPIPGRRLQLLGCWAEVTQLANINDRADFERTNELLHRCIELDASFSPAFAALGRIYTMRYAYTADVEDLDRAVEFAQRAATIDPSSVEASMWLGYAQALRNRPLESYRAHRASLEAGPGSFTPYYFFGLSLLLCYDREAVLVIRSQSEEPVESSSDLHLWRRREARGLLQRSLSLNPQFGWAWMALGCTHLELGDLEAAIHCLSKSIELEPSTVPPMRGSRTYLGDCLRRQGRLDGARQTVLSSLEQLEEADYMYRDTMRGLSLCVLGRIALAEGDLEAANAAFQRAALHIEGRRQARCGGHVMVQALAGQTRATGNPEPLAKAKELFEARSGLDFTGLWALTPDADLLELARAAAAVGRSPEAQALLDRAVEAGASECVL